MAELSKSRMRIRPYCVLSLAICCTSSHVTSNTLISIQKHGSSTIPTQLTSRLYQCTQCNNSQSWTCTQNQVNKGNVRRRLIVKDTVAPFRIHHKFRMPRERLQERANSSAENLILSNTGSTEHIDNNAFINPIGPDSMPSSPPPSYQHVLEETRLAAMSDNKSSTNMLLSSTRTSFDSIGQDSISDRQLSECTDYTSRTNIVQSDDISNSPNEHLNIDTLDNRSTGRLEPDGISNVEMSEISNCPDYQEPSTSFDASSRQLDEDSLVALALIQLDDEIVEQQPNNAYEEFEETENRYNRAVSTRQQSEIIEVANKRSKEMYAALAKELGLSCRMSEQCRCADCQGGYLQCEDAEGDGTDGGLGAGTPMFVSEVFGHGTPPACCIL